MAGHLLIA